MYQTCFSGKSYYLEENKFQAEIFSRGSVLFTNKLKSAGAIIVVVSPSYKSLLFEDAPYKAIEIAGLSPHSG